MLLFWTTLALATDYAEEAKSRMKLDFDLDQVQAELQAPARSLARAGGQVGVPQPALPLTPNSTLDQVVVYRDRALVTRHQAVSLPAGPSTVTFSGLPLALAPESLQARAEGARLVGVLLESGAADPDGRRDQEALRAQARAVADRLGEVQDRMASLLAQRDYLRGAVQGGEEGPAPTVAQLEQTLGFLGRAERDLAAALRKEELAAEDLGKELAPLLTRLANAQATGRTVQVEVVADKPGQVHLELAYQVWGASWSPSYNARYDEGTGKVGLEMFGVVQQGTAETWGDARLVLSTADPAISGTLPELQSWRLGAGNVLLESTSTLSSRNVVVQSADEPEPDDSATFAISRAGGAVLFPVEGRRTVAGDGSETRIPIGSATFPSTLLYTTVPKVVPEVYRRARLRYEGNAPLLPGPVLTFNGADYVGSGQLDTVVPGEELTLAFGTDDRFKVERQLVSRNVEPLGSRRATRYRFVWRTSFTSSLDAPQVVTLVDQIPVSEYEKLTVTPTWSHPPLPERPDDPAGVRRWEITLTPGQKWVLETDLEVVVPRELEGAVAWELDQLY